MSNVPTRRVLDSKVFGLKVVSMHLEGIGIQRIAKQISEETKDNITWRQVNNLLKSAECQKIMAELNDSAMATAKSYARQKAATLMNKAFEVIEKHLNKRDGSLAAVAMVLKVAGVDVAEEKQQQSTTLQVIMPGATEKSVIDIGSTDETDKSSGT